MACLALASFPVSWAIVRATPAKTETAPAARDVTTRVREILLGIRSGQPVSIEDCEKILGLATNVTRLPCVCRGAMRPGSNAACS
jgi:hypothetical protein